MRAIKFNPSACARIAQEPEGISHFTYQEHMMKVMGGSLGHSKVRAVIYYNSFAKHWCRRPASVEWLKKVSPEHRVETAAAGGPPGSASGVGKAAAAGAVFDAGLVRCFHCRGLPPLGNSPSRCSGRKKAHYCSRTCQTAHWKVGHKAGCGAAKATDFADPD